MRERGVRICNLKLNLEYIADESNQYIEYGRIPLVPYSK
jgi:hypothetical protein